MQKYESTLVSVLSILKAGKALHKDIKQILDEDTLDRGLCRCQYCMGIKSALTAYEKATQEEGDPKVKPTSRGWNADFNALIAENSELKANVETLKQAISRYQTLDIIARNNPTL